MGTYRSATHDALTLIRAIAAKSTDRAEKRGNAVRVGMFDPNGSRHRVLVNAAIAAGPAGSITLSALITNLRTRAESWTSRV